MPQGLHKEDPLTPDEREEYESDLIAFCDRELDLLGDIEGLNVLYAGGASPLWLEGLAWRVGLTGRLTALELDPDRVPRAAEILGEATSCTRLVSSTNSTCERNPLWRHSRGSRTAFELADGWQRAILSTPWRQRS